MVAPVLEQGVTSRDVYFPPGRWFEERSGAIYEGPSTETIDLRLGALPTFAREGAIIVRGPAMQHVDEQPLSPLELDLYPGPEATSFTLYEDDGSSLDHEAGSHARTTFELEPTATGAVLRTIGREGTYVPPPRTVLVRVRRADEGVLAVRLGGLELAARADYAALVANGEGHFYDEAYRSIVVAFTDAPTFQLELDYDRAITELRPPLPMTFRVALPPGTPTTTPIYLASSANGWVHVPLAYEPGLAHASGVLSVPRGEWIEYKFTRGDWSTVEKWPGCVEATNRYELGSANPVKEDTVWAWADQCP